METGTTFVMERILRVKNRLTVLILGSHSRDPNELWEAYYDLEEAILMTRILFGGFDRPGKLRKLPDFSHYSDEELRAALRSAENNLVAAEKMLHKLSGDATIERLRRARDNLKAMLALSANKNYAQRTGSRR